MIKKIQTLFLASNLLLLLSVNFIVLAAFSFTSVSAQNLDKAVQCGSGVNLDTSQKCSVQDQVDECKNNTPGSAAEKEEKCSPKSGIEKTLRTIINVFAAIVGAISVIMIIIGGFRYVTSAGDSNRVSGAKNTIIYALVGLIIVAFAQVIVQFVLQRTA